MGREVRATKGRPEEARTDAGAVFLTAPFFVTLRRICAHANPEPSSANRTGYYVEFTNTRVLEIRHLGLFTAHINCLRIIPLRGLNGCMPK